MLGVRRSRMAACIIHIPTSTELHHARYDPRSDIKPRRFVSQICQCPITVAPPENRTNNDDVDKEKEKEGKGKEKEVGEIIS